ncbi:hypothetical protein EU803_03475 [Loktanella sp. IMCC34160]|uniref:hypothetical protein n=1 Tax=Loktanella sp. IMCC34160 TaxID=2510646 RepID=UPI00101C0E3D|nr:hypothetical protein [Loktanella sp. IMCC34160]RYG93175.1 hypothetical protein EU803_03475 [Loktanella sp. IMCC34160]
MRKENEYSPVAQSTLERLRDLASELLNAKIAPEARDRIAAELDLHEATLNDAFAYRQKHGPELGAADSLGYFREKLCGAMSFVRMAVGIDERGGYSDEKIIDNIDHYSFLVSRLLAVNWSSRSARPKTDRVIRESSFDNREALQRLVDR